MATASLVLDNVRLFPRTADAPTTRLTITDGIITSTDRSPIPDGAIVEDCRGALVMPSLGDVHAHLDSNRLDLPFRPHTSDGSLIGLITNDVENWRTAEKSITWRTNNALDRILASGATTIRSHAQVDPQTQLDRFHAVLDARERHSNAVDMQIVAFPQLGIVRAPGALDLMRAALAEGADLIGGIDPCGLEKDPVTHLNAVFSLAEDTGKGIDIHLHERGSLGAFTLGLIAERTHALGMEGKVTVSHCFALASQESNRERDELISLLADADIAVTTIAPAGGVLPVHALREAGVRVGLGEDGMRDYWSPYGTADVLDRTWQLAFTQGAREDADVELMVKIASLGSRSILSGCDYAASDTGLEVGQPGSVVVIDAETVTSAVMDRVPRQLVVHRGRVVARDNNPLNSGAAQIDDLAEDR
ncbi:MAG: amidohydrolase family protein [Actinomycetaceae bacterium]|nr:amidohydrolase family protein [Actinomycetaceae bacterium]